MKAALQAFNAKVQAGQYSEARVAFGKIRKMTLLAREIRDLLVIRAMMPVDQQPVDLTKDFVSDDLSTLVGADVDAMTKDEYVTFFTKFFSEFHNVKNNVDETDAFRLLDYAGTSKEENVKILKTAIETNLDGILAFAKASGSEKDLQWDPKYILGEGLRYLSTEMNPAEFEAYRAAAKAKIEAAIESSPNVKAVVGRLWDQRGASLVD